MEKTGLPHYPSIKVDMARYQNEIKDIVEETHEAIELKKQASGSKRGSIFQKAVLKKQLSKDSLIP